MTFHFSLTESDSEVAILVENLDKSKKWMVLAIPAKYAVNCEMETQIAFALIAAGKQLGHKFLCDTSKPNYIHLCIQVRIRTAHNLIRT